MSKLKELQEKRLSLAANIKELGAKSAEWTEEQRGQWDALNADYDATSKEIGEEVERGRNSEAVQARLAAIEAEQRESLSGKRIGVDAGRRAEADPETIVRNTEAAKALALQAWFRAGRGEELTDEQRSACRSVGINPRSGEIDMRGLATYSHEPAWLSQGVQMRREMRVGLDVATSGAGQETIPTGFLAELDRKMLAFNGPRQVARVIRTASGNSLPMPKVDDTSNTGALLAEATTIGTSVDPTFSAVTLGAYKFSSKAVLISQELIEDSAFSMASEISSIIGERLGRIQASYNTTGTGSSQPEGVAYAATNGVTAASATAFTPDELVDLMHSVDPAYRAGAAGWMMNDAVVKYLRKFKDSDGQYMWQPGMQAGVADRLMGYPIVLNQNMDSAFTTGKKLVLFGDFSKFVIRDVASVRFYRLDERYRDLDQTAFVALLRMDSKILQGAAFKRLTLA